MAIVLHTLGVQLVVVRQFVNKSRLSYSALDMALIGLNIIVMELYFAVDSQKLEYRPGTI